MSIPDAIELTVLRKLETDTELQSLVGGRIYTVAADQGAPRPYLIVSRRGTEARPRNDGPSDFAVCNIEIEAVADPREYGTLKRLCERVRLVLDGWSDRTVKVSACLFDRYADLTSNVPADGSGQALRFASIEFRIQYTQAIT